jgi:MOSC domain-containing protein YiiM
MSGGWGTLSPDMKVISVNVALPREIPVGDRLAATGIFKEPVAGPVRVRTLNLDGDRQANLAVHGGVDKAVYAYPSEHYPFWQQEVSRELAWGAFGENLTVEGMLEENVSPGDRLEIGTALFEVTQPRLPCFKLEAKFQRDDMIKRFLDSRRVGFYLRVLREGILEAGESIALHQSESSRITIRELTDLYTNETPERAQIEHALSARGLSASWRHHFQSMLSR